VNEQIAANKRRTFLMLFGFVVVITLVATALVLLFGGGWPGIVIAFGVNHHPRADVRLRLRDLERSNLDVRLPDLL